MQKIIYVYFLLIALSSCVEEFNYQNKNEKGLLVVEAQISDVANEHYVNLSWTSALNEKNNAVTGATVKVIDSDGTEFLFYENDSGYYLPENKNFKAVNNIEYILDLQIGNNHYVSSPVKLPRTLEIESVSWISSKLDPSSGKTGNEFLSLKVTTNNDESATGFYLYDINETFEVLPTFSATYIYNIEFKYEVINKPYMVGSVFCLDLNDGENFKIPAPREVAIKGSFTNEIFYNDSVYPSIGPFCRNQIPQNNFKVIYEPLIIWGIDSISKYKSNFPEKCWNSNYIKNTDIVTLENNRQNKIINQTIALIPLNKKFIQLYSCLVKQYALEPGYYKFLEIADKFTVNNPTLFEIQPGFVGGNIRNLSSDNERIIGYFNAAAIRTKRIFISYDELDIMEKTKVWQDVVSCKKDFQKLTVKDTSFAGLYPSNDLIMDDSLLYEKQLQVYHRNDTLTQIKNLSHNNFIYAYHKHYYNDSCFHDISFSSKACIDCRENGTENKPQFWPN